MPSRQLFPPTKTARQGGGRQFEWINARELLARWRRPRRCRGRLSRRCSRGRTLPRRSRFRGRLGGRFGGRFGSRLLRRCRLLGSGLRLRRGRRQFDLHRVRPQRRQVAGLRYRFQRFGFRHVAVQREGHGQRCLDRQRQRAGRTASLAIRRFCFGAGRLGFKPHGVDGRCQLQPVEAHPFRCR